MNTSETSGRPKSTRDLRPSESRFAAAMQQLGYGHFDFLRIDQGELVLDPWPSTVRNVKFATTNLPEPKEPPSNFELKTQVAQLFEYVRAVDAGEIRTLEVHHGLPFSMEIEHRQELTAEGRRDV